MAINWQDIFYITATLMMIGIVVVNILLIRWLIGVSIMIRKVAATTQKWRAVAVDILNFRKGITLRVVRFLLTILDKGGEK